jgi:thiol-disulfide isomerase/thioredoxin
MLPLGTKMPKFELHGIDEKTYTNEDFSKKSGTLVMFICNHCPFVKHVNNELVLLSNELLEKNIGVIGINSNDSSQEKYAEDSFDKMQEYALELGYKFHMLLMKIKRPPKNLLLSALLTFSYLIILNLLYIEDN